MAGASSVFKVNVSFVGSINAAVPLVAHGLPSKIALQQEADSKLVGQATAVYISRRTPANVAGQPVVINRGWALQGYVGQATPTGGSGGGSGASGGAGAGVTNALVRGQGTGADIIRGATNILGVGSDVRSEFTGINGHPPDTQIQPNEAKIAVNIDSITRRGELGKRPGTIPSYPNRTVAEANASSSMAVPAKADITNADWYGFIAPDGVRTAIWFDTTGAETVPAAVTAWLLFGATGSAALEVDISAAVTAADVMAAIELVFNAASIGVTSDDSAADGTSVLTVDTAGTEGNEWVFSESVANAGGIIVSPSGGVDGIATALQGRSINVLPAGFKETDRKSVIVTSYDSATNDQLGQGFVGSNIKKVRMIGIEPIYGPQKDIRFVKPVITVTATAAAAIGFSVVMPQRYRLSGVGNIISSVDKLVVIVSTSGYVHDRDNLGGQGGSFLKEYTSWDGTSVNVSDTGVVGVTRYYTVFAVSKQHVSEVLKFTIVPT